MKTNKDDIWDSNGTTTQEEKSLLIKPISKGALYESAVEAIKTVYDPEFPLIDIYTMGLIYAIDIQDNPKKIIISMTFTSPQCPAIDLLQQMTIFAIKTKLPEHEVKLEIVREPLRSPSLIQDEDFKKMFFDM